jgi:hypothetical protein
MGLIRLPGARNAWSEPPLAGPASTASWIRGDSASVSASRSGWEEFSSRQPGSSTGKKGTGERGRAGATVAPSGME